MHLSVSSSRTERNIFGLHKECLHWQTWLDKHWLQQEIKYSCNFKEQGVAVTRDCVS